MANEEDVYFSLEVLDSVAMGDSFDVKVVAKNKSSNKRTVKVNITSVMAFYTGIRAKPLKGTKETLSVNAKKGMITETLQFFFPINELMISLTDRCVI